MRHVVFGVLFVRYLEMTGLRIDIYLPMYVRLYSFPAVRDTGLFCFSHHMQPS